MPVTIDVSSFIGILRGILSELNSLSDEQLQALMNKEAKFKYFDENKPKEKVKAPSIAQANIEEIIDFVSKCKSTEEAKSYLEKQKLTVAKLQDIAKHRDIPIKYKKKADTIDALVEILLGARLRYESIQRT